MVKNPPDSAGDTGEVGSIPGLGKSPGGQYGNPLQYFSWENPMDRGAWPATVHGVAKGLGHDQESAHTQALALAIYDIEIQPF